MAPSLSEPALPKGVFVTGTDTGIGKTLISALLVRAWGAAYWKPYQTGLNEEAGDTPEVQKLSGCAAEDIFPPACALQAPLSPLAAAQLENVTLHPQDLQLPQTKRPLVVEGAGGLMVPLSPNFMMIDLIAQLKLPVILVARGSLGTLNHTLLSLEALHRRNLPVAGIILNGGGEAQKDNQALIEQFGNMSGSTPHLLNVPDLAQVTPEKVQELAGNLRTVLEEFMAAQLEPHTIKS